MAQLISRKRSIIWCMKIYFLSTFCTYIIWIKRVKKYKIVSSKKLMNTTKQQNHCTHQLLKQKEKLNESDSLWHLKASNDIDASIKRTKQKKDSLECINCIHYSPHFNTSNYKLNLSLSETFKSYFFGSRSNNKTKLQTSDQFFCVVFN